MLQNIRDRSQGLGSKIFVGFIIAIFGLWGVESIVGSLVGGTTAVTVNGVDIDEAVVENETSRRTQQLVQSMGEGADLSTLDDGLIRETTINELIQEELLSQAADRAGMRISNTALDLQIASTEAFQVNGVFNSELAQAVLSGGGFSPSSYRGVLADEILMNQILAAYSGSGFITQKEVEDIAALTGQERDLRYMLIDFFDQAVTMEVSDEEISSYYEANSVQFIRDEEVSVDYLVIDKSQLSEQIEITDDQIETRYNEEVETFQSQVERRASHILLEATGPEAIESARALAGDLKEQLDNGASFEQLAQEYSDDLGSNEYGGDVGYTSGDSFVEEFELALQNLSVDEVSQPVVTQFGVHIIKLTEVSSSDFDSLEDSIDRIRADLQLQQVETLYDSMTQELGNLAFESFDIETPAEALNLEIQNSALFSLQGGTGIAAEQAFIDAAFSLDVLQDDLNSDLIVIDGDRSVVMHLSEHVLPDVRPLAEVRVQIQLQLRSEKIREQSLSTGETILNSLENDQNITALIDDQGFSWVQLNELSRDSQVMAPEMLNWIFTLPAPEGNETSTTLAGTQLSSGVYAIVELSNVMPGSVEDLEVEEIESLQAFISQQTGANDFSNYLSALQNEAKIIQQ